MIAATGNRAEGCQQVSIAHSVCSIPQEERISKATEGIFQRFKQQVILIWRSIVSCITGSWRSLTFLFFRVVDFFNPPTLMSRVETAWLYCVNRWDNFWAQRREKELQGENRGLKDRNVELETYIQQITAEKRQLTQDRNRVQLEKDNLMVRNESISQQRDRLIQTRARLERESEERQKDDKATVQDRDHLVVQNQMFTQQIALMDEEKRGLIQECNALREQAAAAMRGRQLALEARDLAESMQVTKNSKEACTDNKVDVGKISDILSEEGKILLNKLLLGRGVYGNPS